MVTSRCQKLPGMTDPLTTQLSSAGTVPPSKRPKLDSVGDGTGEPNGPSEGELSRGGALAFSDGRLRPETVYVSLAGDLCQFPCFSGR